MYVRVDLSVFELRMISLKRIYDFNVCLIYACVCVCELCTISFHNDCNDYWSYSCLSFVYISFPLIPSNDISSRLIEIQFTRRNELRM